MAIARNTMSIRQARVRMRVPSPHSIGRSAQEGSVLRRQVVFVRRFVGLWSRRWRLRLRLFLGRRNQRRASRAGRNLGPAHLLFRQIVLAERGVFLETDLEFVLPRHA